MKKLNSWVVGFAFVTVLVSSAQATPVLSDWCFNVNGDTAANCNTGGNSLIAPISGNFDTTLVPGTNTLGSAVVTLGPGNGQAVLAYMDYDLNYAAAGSFTDYGTVLGTAPAGYSYELNDPNSSSIFSDFAANALTNMNAVGTPLSVGVPGGPCCDVAWALGIGGINVPSGQSATVTFRVSTTDPGGFRLQQVNQYNMETIYLSATVNIGGTTQIPEPGYAGLLGVGLVGLYYLRRRQS